jgi:DNA-binding NtrC family response regulator
LAYLLIIDDDSDGAQSLAEILREEGHQVRVGYDGKEGMRLIRERIPDVALLDVEMPALSGPGMAYQMCIHDRGLEDVPVILLSGVPNLEEVAASVGTPYFLAKPYRFRKLIEVLDRALSERLPPRRPAEAGAGSVSP